MHSRSWFPKTAPELCQAIPDPVAPSPLEPSLLERWLPERVKNRASRINGRAFRLDQHARDAQAHDQTEPRLRVPPARRETARFSTRGRAAVSWSEALTNVTLEGAPEAVYHDLAATISPRVSRRPGARP